MKVLHRMVLKQLPGPFMGWLLLLIFVLLMQFLIKFLPDLIGRDLPLGLILELIAYNLSYMIVLAVPMSSLLATLMVFGSLAETRTWVVIRNCGITLWSFTWPVLASAALLSGGMIYFNNVILPESNFRALNMWQTVRDARPGFELEPGVFYQEISDYSILVGRRENNLLYDILIYDYTQGIKNGATIRADRGELVPRGKFLDILLIDGEMHRLFRRPRDQSNERYEKMTFQRFQLRLDLSELGFQTRAERDGYRSDRSTPTNQMVEIVDSLRQRRTGQTSKLRDNTPSLLSRDTLMILEPLELSASMSMNWNRDESTHASAGSGNPQPDSGTARAPVEGLTQDQLRRTYQRARAHAQDVQSSVTAIGRNIQHTQTTINRYQVEIHKKYSISIACFIFVLIGIPLGLRIERGGLGVAGLVAVGIFIFYWVTLVQGEKLADRELLSPWIGMWCANIVISAVSIWLFIRTALDVRARPKYTSGTLNP